MKRNKFQERKSYKERPLVQEDINITSLLLSTLLMFVIIGIILFILL